MRTHILHTRLIGALLLAVCCSWNSPSGWAQPTKPRTIVTTDGEIDDVDSFIRLLLCANEFNIEGLIYSSSMWHYKGDGKGTKFTSEMEMTQKIYGERTSLRWPGTQWMQDLIGAYEKVYPSLKKHAQYPEPAYLRSVIRVGNINFEGEMEHDTEGSEFIKQKLLDKNPAPLYLQVWGGTNTIARALKSIEDTYKNTGKWSGIYKQICDKIIIYAILDQDATYRKYVSVHWPDIRVYYNSNQFWSLAYLWKRAVPEALHPWLEGAFMQEHIIQGHGPLTQMYYSYGDGQKQAGDDEHIHGDPTKLKNAQWGSFTPYDFISEGDSPSFLHLIDVGLGNLEHPEYGGWGGRLVATPQNPKRWEDGEATADFNPYTQKTDLAYAQTRWIEPLQLDFAARADWCIKDYKNANHPPRVTLEHATRLTSSPGAAVQLRGKATDPDGNALQYRWWQYAEAGTYPGKVELKQADKRNLSFVMPADIGKGQTIHMILEVKDAGTPALTRYARVIIKSK